MAAPAASEISISHLDQGVTDVPFDDGDQPRVFGGLIQVALKAEFVEILDPAAVLLFEQGIDYFQIALNWLWLFVWRIVGEFIRCPKHQQLLIGDNDPSKLWPKLLNRPIHGHDRKSHPPLQSKWLRALSPLLPRTPGFFP